MVFGAKRQKIEKEACARAARPSCFLARVPTTSGPQRSVREIFNPNAPTSWASEPLNLRRQEKSQAPSGVGRSRCS